MCQKRGAAWKQTKRNKVGPRHLSLVRKLVLPLPLHLLFKRIVVPSGAHVSVKS